jgi:cytochrome c oxidase subunit 4
MKQHISAIRTNINVFIALMILLFATVGAAYLPLGRLHFPTAMAIATGKTVLIVMYFMHVKYSHRLTAIICSAAFLWLGIMIALILTDYMTRSPTEWYNWVNIPGK